MRTIAVLATCFTVTAAAVVASAAMAPTATAHDAPVHAPANPALATVAPALGLYTDEVLFGRVWADAALSLRDRSLLTVAALVARSEDEGLSEYIDIALENGVTAAEVSETLTHLAFYAGWPNAMMGAKAAAPVFQAHGVALADLPAADPADMLPLHQAAEGLRRSFGEARLGGVDPQAAGDTAEGLLLHLWRRPALAPRDRSLVTVAALVSTGRVDRLPFHLSRAIDDGLTKDEATAALAHLAFYAGWPNVLSAMPVAEAVFASRGE
ncbi:carboxymuconolactone decarboxylase family protein [Acuticoccus yangtzensis]|uniref:carboxymuconolactone decarboxylase family protein n=1 Tax=Acuticoccus yangtzensis TaxID=1443441 RepID=UPI0009495FC5|nr:carboxymuconolactone decarboxylase family protein [Acuticoccus yangtzensis]